MKGLIYYYSGTGNTRLACEAIAARTMSIDFVLADILCDGIPEMAGIDLVGFAAWADFWNPSERMKSFMEGLPEVAGVPAFVLNTFGSMSGRTLATLHRWAQAKGFRVIAGHSLHTPENFPPLIKRGPGFRDSPNEKELAVFTSFVSELDEMATALEAGGDVPARHVGVTGFLPAFSRTHSRRAMGEKHVDEASCVECGTCRDHCPYGAITLNPKPVFDQSRCYGCWACYNHCPTQAIFTKKLRGVPQYAQPNDALRMKLGS